MKDVEDEEKQEQSRLADCHLRQQITYKVLVLEFLNNQWAIGVGIWL
jgi:hypothetical protein